MFSFLRQVFCHRPLFSDGEIELYLSDTDVSDPECGIDDGYLFNILDKKTRKYVGYVSLRLGESPALFYLGHIGYRIQPEWRGHSYAFRACRMLVPFIAKLRLESIVITTDVDNFASRRTCEKLNCYLESIMPVPPQYRGICSGSVAKCRYIWTDFPRT